MAIVKFGVVVVGARGTIGGIKFSSNFGGPYAAQWSRGSNPRSVAQTDQRALLGTLASSWRSLSQAQRDDWDDYAILAPQEKFNSLGESYFLSGFNWYVAINQNLTAAGEAVRVLAPTLTRPVAPVRATLQLFADPPPSSTFVSYSLADPQIALNHVVFFTLVSSQGRSVPPTRLQTLIIEVPNAITGIIVIQDEVLERFGTTTLGQRGFVSSRAQDAHGQRGPEAISFDDARP